MVEELIMGQNELNQAVSCQNFCTNLRTTHLYINFTPNYADGSTQKIVFRQNTSVTLMINRR